MVTPVSSRIRVRTVLRDLQERERQQPPCPDCGRPRISVRLAVGAVVQTGAGRYRAERHQTPADVGGCVCPPKRYVVRAQDGRIFATPLTDTALGRAVLRMRMLTGLETDVVIEELRGETWVTWPAHDVEACYDRAMYQHQHQAGTESGRCVYCDDPMHDETPARAGTRDRG